MDLKWLYEKYVLLILCLLEDCNGCHSSLILQLHHLCASMRSPNMALFKQQKVEDVYEIGEELGR